MGEPGLCSRCKEVDTEDLPIACTLLEGNPCSACEEKEAIREKIKQLEEELTKLKAKHHALKGRVNAIHDPFIHKLPPEIGSHIFRLCFPTLESESTHLWSKAPKFTGALRLGAVCQKWRQLAWATPDLWDTLYVEIPQPQSMKGSLVQWLPDLLREWLSRSGMRPLTIFFRCLSSEESDHSSSDDEVSYQSPIKNLRAEMVIEVLNLHSGRWRNLYLDVCADIPERFCGSIQPNQLLFLDLAIDGGSSPTAKFVMKSKPFPTQLTLFNFPPTSIDIGWNNITRAKLYYLTADECFEVLRRAPALEYCLIEPEDDATVDFGQTIHPHLRSLDISSEAIKFLNAINVPSLEEWIHSTSGGSLSVTVMVSLLKRSGCCLKILHLQYISEPPDDLSSLFEAMPSLERLKLHFWSVQNADGVIDDILRRIFNSPTGNSTIPEEASCESFLPCLQFMECTPSLTTAPFSWNHIPQLYRQGHRRSLTLKSAAYESHISDDTALQLLKLIDEGVDLQILDRTTEGGGDFLENFRKRVRSL